MADGKGAATAAPTLDLDAKYAAVREAIDDLEAEDPDNPIVAVARVSIESIEQTTATVVEQAADRVELLQARITAAILILNGIDYEEGSRIDRAVEGLEGGPDAPDGL